MSLGPPFLQACWAASVYLSHVGEQVISKSIPSSARANSGGKAGIRVTGPRLQDYLSLPSPASCCLHVPGDLNPFLGYMKCGGLA